MDLYAYMDVRMYGSVGMDVWLSGYPYTHTSIPIHPYIRASISIHPYTHVSMYPYIHIQRSMRPYTHRLSLVFRFLFFLCVELLSGSFGMMVCGVCAMPIPPG